MRLHSYNTVQFSLDASEKETIDKALEIMRKVKNAFFTSKLPEHQKQMEAAMNLMSAVSDGKEISE